MSEKDTNLHTAFIDAEMRLALYYNGLRDKTAALNVAVVGFSFSIYDKIDNLKTEFFIFLIALGLISFIASLRTSIAFNYHFNNYEEFLKATIIKPIACSDLFEKNRAVYSNEKRKFSFITFGLTFIPTHLFWSVSIGAICPTVALFVYYPW